MHGQIKAALVTVLILAFLVWILSFVLVTDCCVITCSSSLTSQINIVSHNLHNTPANGSLGEIAIANVSGGQITSVDLDGDNGLFASHDEVSGTLDGDTSDILPTGNSTIPMYAGSIPGFYSAGNITITYDDLNGTRKSATIRCQGSEITVS